jgi:hypothetical protein
VHLSCHEEGRANPAIWLTLVSDVVSDRQTNDVSLAA